MPYKDIEQKRECSRKASLLWRLNNPDYLKNYLRKNRDKIRIKSKIEGKVQARGTLNWFVKKGALMNLKEHTIECFYCNNRAEEYDHRDYTKPLDVQPVCKSCNKRLPPAKNKLSDC